MDQAFVEDFVKQMTGACSEHDCQVRYEGPAEDDGWNIAVYDEEGERVESALLSLHGRDADGRRLFRMTIGDVAPWTVYVSAVPKAVFSLLWA